MNPGRVHADDLGGHVLLEQGYPSVRRSGQARAAWSVMARDRHAAVEPEVDDLCRSRPLALQCHYAVTFADEDLPHLCTSMVQA